MRFTCVRNELSEAISNVSRAVVAKSNVPALEGILIKSIDDGIRLSGYNLELGITTSISAGVEKQGVCVISARLFGDIVRRLPDDRVTVYIDDNLNAVISSGAAEFTIATIPSEEYPELPEVSSENDIELSQVMLKSMIKQTKFAVSIDESRPVHTGIKFEVEDDILRLIAVDGVRLAIRKEKINYNGNLSFIVPGKTLGEIEKLLSEEEEAATISVGRKQIVFNIGRYCVISRLLEGEFLDYNSAIPKTTETEAYIQTRMLTECMERAALIITERLQSPVRCIFENGKVQISCITPIGKSYDEFDANMSGKDVEIGFNNRFVIDALRASECDYVRVILNGPTSPIKILPAEGDSFLFLILPVRLKNEI